MFKYLNLHTLNQHRLTHYSTLFDVRLMLMLMLLIMDDEDEDKNENNAGVLFCSISSDAVADYFCGHILWKIFKTTLVLLNRLIYHFRIE